MTPARKLHIVAPEPEEEQRVDTSYEWKERQRIRNKDWARVHIAADRRAPVFIPDQVRRLWRR